MPEGCKMSDPEENIPTPLTDAAENFIYYEVPPPSPNYDRSRRPGKHRVGFVLSEFARQLEREIVRLKSQIKDL